MFWQMKKAILLFVALVCGVIGANAQNFKAGLSFGIVPSQVDGDGMTGFHKIGLTGGAYIKWDTPKSLFYQADIAYTMKGSRQASSKTPNFSQSDLILSYIDLTLAVGYRIMDNLSLKAGLVPSVLISSKEQLSGGEEVIGSRGFRRFNLLAMAGATYFFSSHWAVNLTYDYSVMSLRKGKVEVFDYDLKEQNAQYHNYLTLTLTYQF